MNIKSFQQDVRVENYMVLWETLLEWRLLSRLAGILSSTRILYFSVGVFPATPFLWGVKL